MPDRLPTAALDAMLRDWDPGPPPFFRMAHPPPQPTDDELEQWDPPPPSILNLGSSVEHSEPGEVA